METFGEKLRQAVESRGLLLDEVAEASGLGIENVRALERNDFGALPEDRVVIEGLRSFARLVEVDPDQVVADYLRERQESLVPVELEIEEGRESIVESDEWLLAEPSKPGLRRLARTAILASVILAVAVIAYSYWSRTSTATASRQPAVPQDNLPLSQVRQPAQPQQPQTVQPAQAVQAAPVTPGSPDAEAGSAMPPAPSPSRTPGAMTQLPASRLSIPEHGVGRGVVHHELVGKDERFAEGERVWFWTLVQGGMPGESIDHVWLHEGKEAFRVTMDLGGARWRTRSYHDLSPGSKGRWAVEARDEFGHLLARAEFDCSARP